MNKEYKRINFNRDIITLFLGIGIYIAGFALAVLEIIGNEWIEAFVLFIGATLAVYSSLMLNGVEDEFSQWGPATIGFGIILAIIPMMAIVKYREGRGF